MVAIAGVLAAALSGCTSAEYREERRENLNSALAEFDAESLGEVLCDVSGGKVAAGNSYTHSYLFDGTEAGEAIADRFAELDYTTNGDGPFTSFSRSDGIIASSEIVDESDVERGVDEKFKDAGCDVPAVGNILLHFTER